MQSVCIVMRSTVIEMHLTNRNLALIGFLVSLGNAILTVAVSAVAWWAGSLLSFWELNPDTFIGVVVLIGVIQSISGKWMLQVDIKR